MARLVQAFTFALLLTACGDDDGPSEPSATEADCRASFQDYADAVAADDDFTLDEDPLASATVNSCGSRAEWLDIAEEFQGSAPSDLFPPNPIGGLGNVLSAFCDDNNENAPACE